MTTSSRTSLKNCKRIVVKIGTRVLVGPDGKPDRRRIQSLVNQMASLRKKGIDVVLVSSGAIGAGIEALGLKARPKTLPELQMAAAVGQSRLIALYGQYFAKHKILVGQVLLTHDDLKDRTRHLNARNTMQCLLRNGIIPVVNENDVVSVDEIKFGDNDHLGALVTLLIDAEALILLSTTDGLRDSVGKGRSKRVSEINRVNKTVLSLVQRKQEALSTGGMASKLGSAQMVVDDGRLAIIADGRKPKILEKVIAGEDVGTIIGGVNEKSSNTKARKKWIAFFNRSLGSITIDDGAAHALIEKGFSLLPIGVRKIEGEFVSGSVISVKSSTGVVIAQGLTHFGSNELKGIIGKRTSEVRTILGSSTYEEVIHRDNLVIVKGME